MSKRTYWFCLRHHTVEEEQGCRSADRLGPYDTAEDAAQALERARERTEAWEHDPTWMDDDDA
jgi:hypothetical protein